MFEKLMCKIFGHKGYTTGIIQVQDKSELTNVVCKRCETKGMLAGELVYWEVV